MLLEKNKGKIKIPKPEFKKFVLVFDFAKPKFKDDHDDDAYESSRKTKAGSADSAFMTMPKLNIGMNAKKFSSNVTSVSKTLKAKTMDKILRSAKSETNDIPESVKEE